MGENIEERIRSLEYNQLLGVKEVNDLKNEISRVKDNQETHHVQIKAMFDSIMSQITAIQKWQYEKDAIAVYKEKQDSLDRTRKGLWLPLVTEWFKILLPVFVLLAALAVQGGANA